MLYECLLLLLLLFCLCRHFLLASSSTTRTFAVLSFINITLFCVCARSTPGSFCYSCIFIVVFSFYSAQHMNNDVYTLYIHKWLNAECAKKCFLTSSNRNEIKEFANKQNAKQSNVNAFNEQSTAEQPTMRR